MKLQGSPLCSSRDDMALVDTKGSGACPRLSPMDVLKKPFDPFKGE